MLYRNKCTKTKPKSKPTLMLKNCSYVCEYTQHRTVLIVFPLKPHLHDTTSCQTGLTTG